MQSTRWMRDRIARRPAAGLSIGLLACLAAMAGSAQAQITLPAAGIINTVAGDGSWSYSGDGGPAISAALKFPSGVAVDSAGNVYITDTYNERIREVSAATGDISTVAGSGTLFSYNPNDGDGLPAIEAYLNDPTGIAVDSAGNIYIADTNNQQIRKVTAATGIISTVAGDGTAGHTGDGGAATGAELYNPNGIAVDAAGNLYIGDTSNNVIRKVAAATGIITTVAGTGTAGYIDNIAATSGELNAPYGVAVDSLGNIYIGDAKNNVVRKVTAATGIISTVAGYGPAGYSGDNGAAVNAELDYPTGVAVNAAGDLYITDLLNERVREVRGATQIITTVAGTGTEGYSGDNAAASGAEVAGPSDVAVDHTGNIYIADMYNNRVRAVGVPPLVLGTYDPHYQITSILYAAPGNMSSSGLSNTTTAGASLTIDGSIFSNTMIAIPWGQAGPGVASTNIGIIVTGTASNQITETWSNDVTVVNQNKPTSPDAINHNNDLFLIWLNQSISIWYQDSVPVYYNIGVQGGALPDIVQIFAVNMEANASGQTTVPAALLNQQIDPATGVKTPGLAAICQNILAAEYSAGSCTVDDQCGCTPSDFAPVLALDPLLNSPGTQSPLVANGTSGTANCGTLPIPSGNCRYVPVSAAPGSSLQQVKTLMGPESPGGNSACTTVSQSDATMDTITLGGSVQVSVAPFSLEGTFEEIGLSAGFSVGAQAGITNAQNVTLCSATVGCAEDVAVYEDTAFHTFVYQQPQGNNSCTQ